MAVEGESERMGGESGRCLEEEEVGGSVGLQGLFSGNLDEEREETRVISGLEAGSQLGVQGELDMRALD